MAGVPKTVSNIMVNGLDWSIAIPLTLASFPGCMIGAKIAPLMRASYIHRAIVPVELVEERSAVGTG